MTATKAPTTSNGTGASPPVRLPTRKPAKLPAVPNGKNQQPDSRNNGGDESCAVPNGTTQQPATLMQAIIQASADPTVDVGKIGALVNLHQQMQSRDWEQKYNAAMSLCQSELEPVTRNQQNTSTNSRYADLAKLAESALPVIHRHGFALVFGEVATAKPNHIGVAVRISHRDGHVERTEFHVPADVAGFKGTPNKTAIHGWGSALTYCRRYALLCAFNVVVAGDDDGQAAGAKAVQRAADVAAGRLAPSRQQEDAVTALESALMAVDTADGLERIWNEGRHAIRSWPRAWRERIITIKDRRKAELANTLRQLERSVKQLDGGRLYETWQGDKRRW